MAEDAAVEVTQPRSAFHQSMSFSSSLRFLGLPNQADSYLHSLDEGSSPLLSFGDELDERDVVWSYEGSFSPDACPVSDSHSPSAHLRRLLMAGRCGLSALLAEDTSPMVRRRLPTVEAARVSQPARALPATGRVDDSEVASRRWIHHQSAPINVPAWPKWIRKAPKAETLEEMDYGENEKYEAAEAAWMAAEMLPPHEIVARSQAATSTFSVFEGVGRTLKGRDLRRVRNAVLRSTGFLDL